MATRDYEGKKVVSDEVIHTVDSLTIEEALQININGKAFTVTMRTPGDDMNLVRGLLHSEGILHNRNYIPDIILREENKDGVISIVDLTIPEEELGKGYTNSRSLLSVSSCGICGKTELEELAFMGAVLDDSEKIDPQLFSSMFDQMNQYQKAFHQSGGAHAAAAFNINGDLICSMEDIGRHNAVDKVVGNLILTEKLKEATSLIVSGRISYEIIIKSFKARIPVLAAVSAPSSLAVDYAKELGISLFAFCRDNRSTCYSHPKRIKINHQNTQAS